MFTSPTYGELSMEDMLERMRLFYEKNAEYTTEDNPIRIIIGTDSQNFSFTKIVSVIAVVCGGHGGTFFYEVTKNPLIRDVRTKLHVETNDSLKLAETIVEKMTDGKKYEEMYLSCPISIHIDAGNSARGKTKDLIPELVGWIKSVGYDCSVKPESFVASTIADRISK